MLLFISYTAFAMKILNINVGQPQLIENNATVMS